MNEKQLVQAIPDLQTELPDEDTCDYIIDLVRGYYFDENNK